MAVGICKIPNGWANQDSVKARYPDGREEEMPADHYLAQGYNPPIDDLPDCGDGNA